jgi:formate dehydrogenase subunit gamma
MADPLHTSAAGAVAARSTGDPAILVAQERENLVVGDVLVRFRYVTRVIHWGVAVTFFICLFTGLPIWTPIFGWMATLFGGLQVCRWLHAWTGILFSFFALLQFLHWISDMHMGDADKRFIKLKNFLAYMRWQTHDEEVGKYNGGQKILFWMSSLASLGLLLTGIVLWWPNLFGAGLRELSWLLHDVTFILFVLLIMGHIYLSIAEPGTFSGMVKGTVTKDWARLHHPRWYRDVTGDKR